MSAIDDALNATDADWLRNMSRMLPSAQADRMRRIADQIQTVERAQDELLRCKSVAAKQGTKLIRMRFALKLARAWGVAGSEGWDSGASNTVVDWIDGGMDGPIPAPNSPFVTRWMEQHAISIVEGCMGHRATARLVDQEDEPHG